MIFTPFLKTLYFPDPPEVSTHTIGPKIYIIRLSIGLWQKSGHYADFSHRLYLYGDFCTYGPGPDMVPVLLAFSLTRNWHTCILTHACCMLLVLCFDVWRLSIVLIIVSRAIVGAALKAEEKQLLTYFTLVADAAAVEVFHSIVQLSARTTKSPLVSVDHLRPWAIIWS